MCWVVFLFTPVNLFLLGHYFSFISFCTMWSELWPLLNTFGAEHHRKLGRSCAAFEWFMLTKMLWHRCTAIQGCLHTTSCTRSLQHSMVYCSHRGQDVGICPHIGHLLWGAPFYERKRTTCMHPMWWLACHWTSFAFYYDLIETRAQCSTARSLRMLF